LVLSTIEEAMDTMENKISWQDIAKAAGITKSALSHAKNNGTEFKFATLLKIAKFIFKKEYFSTFKQWCLKLNNPMNLRYALEYLAVNKQTNELDELVEKILAEGPSRELLDWASAYKIQVMYQKFAPTSEILNAIRLYNPKSVETKTLISIIEACCKHRLREYNSMAASAQGLDNTIESIKEDFIKQSFQIRVKELLSYVYLNNYNKPEKAREYALEIISSEFCATLTAHSYYIIGISYLFDNYELCLGNIQKYRDALMDLGRENYANIADQSDIPFVNNVWAKYSEPPVTSDISEIAHYEAMVGNKEKAIRLIDEVESKRGQSGFTLYQRALATGDKSLFMQSMVYFVTKAGGKFYANLPYRHLKDDPIFAPVADLLLKD
jgi:transcriptional regulator with XRE-family HTH domain